MSVENTNYKLKKQFTDQLHEIRVQILTNIKMKRNSRSERIYPRFATLFEKYSKNIEDYYNATQYKAYQFDTTSLAKRS